MNNLTNRNIIILAICIIAVVICYLLLTGNTLYSTENMTNITLLHPPQNLTLIPQSSKLQLVWDPVDGAVSYNIYRYTSNYQFWLPSFNDISQFTKIGCIQQNVVFIDTPVPINNDQIYYYGVTAINSAGKEGTMSDYSSILIPQKY